MDKKNIIVLTITILLFIVLVSLASYAFFAISNLNIASNLNVTINTEENNMVFDSIGGTINLTVPAVSLQKEYEGTVIAENNTTLSVSFIPNVNRDMKCLYDIVYEWTSSDKYQTHSPDVIGNEFTIQARYLDMINIYPGENYIRYDTDLADIVGTQNSAVVVKDAEIGANGTTNGNALWFISAKFYNSDGDQSAMAGKTYTGRIKVSNVRCKAGTTTPKPQTLVDYLINDAPQSGTDAVSNSPWILTSDRNGEWRYAGKNPDNYIEFNGELWRIIGVMPDMEYCTSAFSSYECATNESVSLVKIIRNQSISSANLKWDHKQSGVGSSTSTYGSNDWSDSQLMLMFNGTNYLKTGYDVNGNKLHQSYTITSNVAAGNGYNFYNSTYSYLDGTGTTVYVPSSATTSAYTATSGSLYKKIESSALNQIATVKWDLYGTNSYDTAAEGSPAALYNKERNINNTGAVYTGTTPENRPVYWYGKIGLMYPSDYGYATNGGNTYNRATCLGYYMNGWSSGSYKTDCALKSYLLFQNITSTAPGTSGTVQWTMSPCSGIAYSVFYVNSTGSVNHNNTNNAYAVRPVLYLKPDIIITGGTGKWNDPYTIQ